MAEDAQGIRMGNWPHGFILPLKRLGANYIQDPDALGFLLISNKTEVVIGNIMDLTSMEKMKRIKYSSIEELVKEWMVD
jgi:hypothetical protein